MIILFAPAKTFDFNAPNKKVTYHFKTQTLDIIKNINELDDSFIQTMLKLPISKLNETLDFYRDFDNQKSFLAMSFFMGESYKALKYDELSGEEKTQLDKKTFILDALYGIIKPEDGIKPYRLDFTMGLDLKVLWKQKINTYFNPYKKEPFLSLASKEFSSLIDKKQYDLYEVSFYECRDGVCKAVSVFNKQMRGYLLSYIIKNKIETITDLPKSFLGYALETKNNQLNYKRLVD